MDGYWYPIQFQHPSCVDVFVLLLTRCETSGNSSTSNSTPMWWCHVYQAPEFVFYITRHRSFSSQSLNWADHYSVEGTWQPWMRSDGYFPLRRVGKRWEGGSQGEILLAPGGTGKRGRVCWHQTSGGDRRCYHWLHCSHRMGLGAEQGGVW